MSDAKVMCESYTRTSSINNNNSSTNNNIQDNSDSNGNRRSPATPTENSENPKSRSSFLDNIDRDKRSPREFIDQRWNSSHGLDLSKSPIGSQPEEVNGLDLSKPELISANTYNWPSESMPATNGIPSDTQPASASVSYAPGRSHSAGEAVSPFRADSVPSGYSPDNLTNGGGYKSKFQETCGKSLDPGQSRFPEGYGGKGFDPISSPGLIAPTAESPIHANKINDSYLASKLAESPSFPKPHDTYSKILEDFGNNARNINNNNSITGSKINDDYQNVGGKLPDSPYRKIAESYAKQIESLGNGYKIESSIFKQENSLSPGAFKPEPLSLGSLIKPDPVLTNGSSYGSKTDTVSSSSSQSPSQSLPSIMNFSTNHFRGIAGAESGLASYLNSYGVGGAGSERGENRNGGSGGGGSKEGQNGGSGGGGGDSSISRASPNNKLACRFCGKTFSQAGYIKAHERLHTGEKPFACSVCGKRFSDPSNWKKHERVHSNNKKQPHMLDSHESKVCGRTFAQSGSYRMHERRHMTDSIQRCHICYATFTSWQDLQRHMASHPQVTQAILEFEEGNQGILDRLNPVDMGGQLGDGTIGQLGPPDGDGQSHGHSLLQGECGNQRDLGVHHPRCPPPLIPESLLLDSEAAAFHVQSQGLYHSPGQLPPFSSILPFRHHPGGPPTFPPSFPPGLGLLGPQSLGVAPHADLLSKHPFFGAIISSQMKHDAFSKVSPTFSSQQQQVPQHHLHHQQLQDHPDHHPQRSEHSASDGTDVVSTTSAKRADLEQRNMNRVYSPEERSDTETVTNLKEEKESSAFARSVSSDEGLHSPDENHMETNGDEEAINHDNEIGEGYNDDDTDIDERNYPCERNYSRNRRFSQNGDRGGGGGGGERERDRDRERGGFNVRNRSRSFEGGPEKDRREVKKERNPSGGSGSSGKHSNGNRERDFDYDVQDRDRDYERDYGRDTPLHNGRNKTSISRLDQKSSDRCSPKDKGDNKNNSTLCGNNSDNINNNNNSDNSDLRPPKRHIERQNLNTRMMPSSSSRKQRHPMRRFSSAGSEQESPQSTSSLPVSSTTVEAIERGDLDDNDLVTFLLTKGRVHKCVHCHMIFEDASLFLLHNGFHSHDEPFRCVVCSTVCKDRVDFNCHLTSHIK